MSPEFLSLYQQELAHIRDMAQEFAAANPSVAGHLGIASGDVSDPHVERLLEGFAFMAARVQLKLEAQYPAFTNTLLEALLPGAMAPIPAMGIVGFEPDHLDPRLLTGVRVPRHTLLQTKIRPFDRTPVTFRTAHDVQLWPIKIEKVDYLAESPTVLELGARASLQLVLRTTQEVNWADLTLDCLSIHVTDDGGIGNKLFDHLAGQSQGVFAHLPDNQFFKLRVAMGGTGSEHAMLPDNHIGYSGFRLLQETLFLPSRLRFLELSGLSEMLSHIKKKELTLTIPLSQCQTEFLDRMTTRDLRLFCSPSINLFDKRCDRITWQNSHEEVLHSARIHPYDFEIHSVTQVDGHYAGQAEAVKMPQMLKDGLHSGLGDGKPSYCLMRHHSPIGKTSSDKAWRSAYTGSDMRLALNFGIRPANQAIQIPKHLSVHALCTNRDLPLLLAWGSPEGDFKPPEGKCVKTALLLEQPSKPYLPSLSGESAWGLIEHLQINYHGLLPHAAEANALSGLMKRLINPKLAEQRARAESLIEASTKGIYKPIMMHGRQTMVRGLEVKLLLDDNFCQQGGYMPIALALQAVLCRYVSVNSFIDVIVSSTVAGAMCRLPHGLGCRTVA